MSVEKKAHKVVLRTEGDGQESQVTSRTSAAALKVSRILEGRRSSPAFFTTCERVPARSNSKKQETSFDELTGLKRKSRKSKIGRQVPGLKAGDH